VSWAPTAWSTGRNLVHFICHKTNLVEGIVCLKITILVWHIWTKYKQVRIGWNPQILIYWHAKITLKSAWKRILLNLQKSNYRRLIALRVGSLFEQPKTSSTTMLLRQAKFYYAKSSKCQQKSSSSVVYILTNMHISRNKSNNGK